MKRTPLYSAHEKAGGKFAPFAGWEMPLHYGSQIEEHHAVRQGVGVFDVSHMGRILVNGPRAGELLARWFANNPLSLTPGRSQYGALCLEDGGMLDDVIVSRLDEEEWFVVVNAGRRDEDFARLEEIREHTEIAADEAELRDISDETSMLAVQGPGAESALREIGIGNFSGMYPFDIQRLEGDNRLASRTGYTGEDGFEVIVPNAEAEEIWNKLVAAGARPAGLAARDTLRLEAGYLLSGQDFTEATNPYEAGLSWCTRPDREPAPAGAAALADIKANGPAKRFVGLVIEGRGIPRHGYELLAAAEEGAEVIGEITSGTFSPTLQQGIALGYVKPGYHKKGTQIGVKIRNRVLPAEISRPPFVRATSLKPRRK